MASDGMKTHRVATAAEESSLSRYLQLVVGKKSLLSLAYFEWCLLLGAIPGAAGLFLRKIFWPKLLGSCGRDGFFAAQVVLRHPGRIHAGHRVVISEGCICDARSPDMEKALTLGDDVTLSNNVMLSCKDGSIAIGDRCGVGAQTIIHSAHGNPVSIGADTVIGPRCYLVGGGNYNTGSLDIPMADQGIQADGGVTLEDDVWLGANVTVLGGVTMGRGSIAAAGAVVTKAVAPYEIVAGVPARVVRKRGEEKDPARPE